MKNPMMDVIATTLGVCSKHMRLSAQKDSAAVFSLLHVVEHSLTLMAPMVKFQRETTHKLLAMVKGDLVDIQDQMLATNGPENANKKMQQILALPIFQNLPPCPPPTPVSPTTSSPSTPA